MMSVSLCACSNSSKVPPQVEFHRKINTAVSVRAGTHCRLIYGIERYNVTCPTVDDNGDGTYDVKGYVTLTDEYGDKYKGKFDAVVTTDDNGEADCTDFNLETPTKVK